MKILKIRVEKIVFGGESLGKTEDGQTALIWNALQGEEVVAKTYKKKGTIFGVATEITTPSVDRIPAREDHFLACSPWQILASEKEAEVKKEVITELFERQFNINLPNFNIVDSKDHYNYRNKMEFSFYGDEEGISLAFYKRGSKGKFKLTGCELAKQGINKAAASVLAGLNSLNIRAGDLKSLVIRENKDGKVMAALFTKLEDFPSINVDADGFSVYYSDPKSPVSVATKLIYQHGINEFSEEILGKQFIVNVLSFSQVNIPVFEKALLKIKEFTNGAEKVIDFYAGSGAIGLSLDSKEVVLIEENKEGVEAGEKNIAVNKITNAKFINAKSEDMLDYIGKETVIFDPPRSGLHPKVVKKVNEVLPEKIIYLSCNPATQGRDLAEMLESYEIEFFEAYNFFPRTPHIETLAVLKRK